MIHFASAANIGGEFRLRTTGDNPKLAAQLRKSDRTLAVRRREKRLVIRTELARRRMGDEVLVNVGETNESYTLECDLDDCTVQSLDGRRRVKLRLSDMGSESLNPALMSEEERDAIIAGEGGSDCQGVLRYSVRRTVGAHEKRMLDAILAAEDGSDQNPDYSPPIRQSSRFYLHFVPCASGLARTQMQSQSGRYVERDGHLIDRKPPPPVTPQPCGKTMPALDHSAAIDYRATHRAEQLIAALLQKPQARLAIEQGGNWSVWDIFDDRAELVLRCDDWRSAAAMVR